MTENAKPNTTTNNEIILERVGNIQTTMVDIKDSLRTLTDSFRSFQLEYTKSHADVVNRTEDAHTRIDDVIDNQAKRDQQLAALTTQVQELAKSIVPLVLVNKIAIFLLGALVTSIVVYGFMILFHVVNFP